jgi:hypothetical protein
MSTPTITHFGTSRTREAPPLGRVFTYKTLPMKGIDYHPNHIRRLVHAGKFPSLSISARASRFYLERCGACYGATQAAPIAWRRYRRWRS